jgi:hypothetical protein
MRRGSNRWLWLLVIVGLNVAVAGCGRTSGTAEITVPATQTWTDTNISLAKGQQLTINATGEVVAGTDLRCGPGGFADKPQWKAYSVLAEAPHIALIGKIGEDGAPFLVGTRYQGTAARKGRLFLGVNDKDAANNDGRYIATVTFK